MLYSMPAGLVVVLYCCYTSTCASPTSRVRRQLTPDGFCAGLDKLLLSTLDTISSTSKLIEAFCSRSDVSELTGPEGSCQTFIEQLSSQSGAKVKAAPVSQVDLERIVDTAALLKTLHEIAYGTSELSRRTGSMLSVHIHCECPLTSWHRNNCPHRQWIVPLAAVAGSTAGGYCTESSRLFQDTHNKLHALEIHTKGVMQDMGLQQQMPLHAPAQSSVGPLPISDTVERLTYSLVTLTNIVKQAEVTLGSLCHVCEHSLSQCGYFQGT